MVFQYNRNKDNKSDNNVMNTDFKMLAHFKTGSAKR